MSTSYYRLRDPFTSIRAKTLGIHTHLSFWVNGAHSGTLILRNDEVKLALLVFASSDIYDDLNPPLRTHWGGADVGTVVTVNDPSLADDAIIVSEYGDLLTVGEVKARAGARRSDGYPTELFRYEKS